MPQDLPTLAGVRARLSPEIRSIWEQLSNAIDRTHGALPRYDKNLHAGAMGKSESPLRQHSDDSNKAGG